MCKLTLEEQLQLFKPGYRGIIIKDKVGNYKDREFVIVSTRPSEADPDSIVIKIQFTLDGSYYAVFPEEILITKPHLIYNEKNSNISSTSI
jgi:hypothetical protein